MMAMSFSQELGAENEVFDETQSKIMFMERHPECHTHFQQVFLDSARLVPIPLGPSIPRRDRPQLYERYCRLMLIFSNLGCQRLIYVTKGRNGLMPSTHFSGRHLCGSLVWRTCRYFMNAGTVVTTILNVEDAVYDSTLIHSALDRRRLMTILWVTLILNPIFLTIWNLSKRAGQSRCSVVYSLYPKCSIR